LDHLRQRRSAYYTRKFRNLGSSLRSEWLKSYYSETWFETALESIRDPNRVKSTAAHFHDEPREWQLYPDV